jgi:hypothetical protein
MDISDHRETSNDYLEGDSNVKRTYRFEPDRSKPIFCQMLVEIYIEYLRDGDEGRK